MMKYIASLGAGLTLFSVILLYTLLAFGPSALIIYIAYHFLTKYW